MKSTTILAILATANAASHSISWKGLAKGSRGSSCAEAQKVIEADWYDVTFLSASSDQSCSKAGKRDKTYKTVYNCKASTYSTFECDGGSDSNTYCTKNCLAMAAEFTDRAFDYSNVKTAKADSCVIAGKTHVANSNDFSYYHSITTTSGDYWTVNMLPCAPEASPSPSAGSAPSSGNVKSDAGKVLPGYWLLLAAGSAALLVKF